MFFEEQKERNSLLLLLLLIGRFYAATGPPPGEKRVAGPPSDAGIRASFGSVSPRLLSTVDAGEGSRRSRGGRRAATGMQGEE